MHVNAGWPTWHVANTPNLEGVSEEPPWSASSPEGSAHIEELKRIASRYLERTKPISPKVFTLPMARQVIMKNPDLAPSGVRRCNARARIEISPYPPASQLTTRCDRPKGHPGLHYGDGGQTRTTFGRRLLYRWDSPLAEGC
jgi:hypothetical protein